jgi:predicted nucleic acid-binding protein
VSFIVDSPPVVIDASAAIEFLQGESAWTQLFDDWAASDRLLLAPAHFLAEVANGQLVGQGVPPADVATRLERLVAAGVERTDRGLHGLLEAIHLADSHGLTVYDALYLQLALDTDAQLATLDMDLSRAARAEGLTVAG